MSQIYCCCRAWGWDDSCLFVCFWCCRVDILFVEGLYVKTALFVLLISCAPDYGRKICDAGLNWIVWEDPASTFDWFDEGALCTQIWVAREIFKEDYNAHFSGRRLTNARMDGVDVVIRPDSGSTVGW